MEMNVGGFDRTLRLVLGPTLILVAAVGFYGIEGFALVTTLELALGVVAVLVGLVFTVTGITRKCPINRALGIDTYRGARERTEPPVEDRKTGKPQ
jgi:hypothetical protein